jgi:hypothetical protein
MAKQGSNSCIEGNKWREGSCFKTTIDYQFVKRHFYHLHYFVRWHIKDGTSDRKKYTVHNNNMPKKRISYFIVDNWQIMMKIVYPGIERRNNLKRPKIRYG